MPKKTREEKILARLRRLEKDQNQPKVVNGEDQPSSIAPKISFDFKSPANVPTTSPTTPTSADYSCVYKDLTKTIVFAACAVIFEVALRVFVLN